MFCINCGKENKDNAKYCKYCGTYLVEEPMELLCPQCSKKVDEDDVFCDYCGYRLKEEKQTKIRVLDKDYEDVEDFPIINDYVKDIPMVKIKEVPEEEACKPLPQKTIEDYEFPEEIVEEPVGEIEEVVEEEPIVEPPKKLNINDFFKKEKKKEVEEPAKPVIEKPVKPAVKEKKANVFLIVLSGIILLSMFIPFFTEDVFIKKGNTNFLVQIEKLYKALTSGSKPLNTQVFVSGMVEKVTLLAMVGILAIVIGLTIRMILLFTKNIQAKIFNNSFNKYVKICLALMGSYLVLFDAYGFATIIIILILLVMLIFQYIYRIKDGELRNKKYEKRVTLVVLCFIVLFGLLTFMGSIEGTKTSLLSDFYEKAGMVKEELRIKNGNNKEDYVGDFVKFLAASSYATSIFASLMGIYILVKTMNGVKEKWFFKSSTCLFVMTILSTISLMIVYNITCDILVEKKTFGEVLGYINLFSYSLIIISLLASIFFFLHNRKHVVIEEEEEPVIENPKRKSLFKRKRED